MLTLDQLKAMPSQCQFATGEIENGPDGLYMTSSDIGRKLRWIAVRGGYHDWAIFTYWSDQGFAYVLSHGQKVTSETNIKKLVPCTDEAFSMYRF